MFLSSAQHKQSQLEAGEEVSAREETWNAFNLASGQGVRTYLELSLLVKGGGKIQSLYPLSLGSRKSCVKRRVWHADMTLQYTFLSAKRVLENSSHLHLLKPSLFSYNIILLMHIHASMVSTAHKVVILGKIILSNCDITESDMTLFAATFQTPDGHLGYFGPKIWKVAPFTVSPTEGHGR